MSGHSIGGLRDIDKPVRLDVICRHTLAVYCKSLRGDKLGIWVEGVHCRSAT